MNESADDHTEEQWIEQLDEAWTNEWLDRLFLGVCLAWSTMIAVLLLLLFNND